MAVAIRYYAYGPVCIHPRSIADYAHSHASPSAGGEAKPHQRPIVVGSPESAKQSMTFLIALLHILASSAGRQHGQTNYSSAIAPMS